MTKFRNSASTAAIAIFGLAGAFGAVSAQAQTAPETVPPGPAAAADPSRPPSVYNQQGIQDIVVTASRREQNLQKAAIPVTAISGADLNERGANTVKDLTQLIPALKIGELSSGAFQITTRGVGTFGGNNFAEPGVSVNLDGAYLPRTQGSNGIFYDVARIELLKGPQGTLYGRNTTGGVLNIITNDPTDTLGGNITLESGNYDLKRASAALNLPIAEGIALRVAGQGIDRDGYLSDNYGDEKGFAGRAKLKLDPTQDLSILLEANYTAVKGQGNISVFRPFLVPGDPYVGPTDPRLLAPYKAVPPPLGPLLTRPTPNGFQRIDTRGLQGTVNYDFGPVKAALIVNNVRTTAHYLQYGNGFPVADDTRKSPLYYTTAEFRLASAGGGPLKWVIGAFYFNDENNSNPLVNQGFTIADAKLTLRTKSYSGFGEATYSIDPSVRVTLGGRYTSDKKSIDGFTINPPVPCPPPAVVSVDPLRGMVCITTDQGAGTFSKFTYKAGIDADIGPHSLVYANYATGFKSGSFFAAPNTAAADAFPTNAYKPEKIQAWTVGSKNRFLDNTLQVNAEAFYWKYKDKQVSHLGFVPPANVVLLVDNAGDATIYGAELEVQWQPSRNDHFEVNVQYQHSNYDKFSYNQVIPSYAQPAPPGFPAPIPLTGCSFTPTVGVGGAPRGRGVPGISTIDCSGRPISLAPTWVATMSYRHTFDLGSSGTIVPLVATNISSAYWAGEEYFPGERQSSFTKSDASLTYNTADGAFSLTAFVDNIENKAVIESALIQSSLGKTLAYLAAPRTYGIRVAVRF